MTRGVLDTVKLAVTLAFAIPIAFFGVDVLLRGETLVGGVALAVAILMVVVEESLTTPGDLPEAAARRAVRTVVGRDGTADRDGADGTDGTERRDGD